ncbi:MAG: NAD-dependent epimerase/dehydratase family protein [Solirubrobacterales bacterium]
MTSDRGPVLVAGAGGFIGGHLVARLLSEGHEVRAADIKPLDEWFQIHDAAENVRLDLTRAENCDRAVDGIADVYNLASDMGGMGFIENNKALCMLSVLINTHLLMSAKDGGCERYFYASSACVYPDYRQSETFNPGLKESDAYPAMPEDGYGWEKLFSERLCRHFLEDFGLQTRSFRYHNVYGPHGTWTGGREKAPAAISRKVAEAKLGGTGRIPIWGDGKQSRSFMYIDDCVEGTRRLMESDVTEPLNLGSDEMVTIDELVSIVEDIAGVELERVYDTSAPQGVRGRNSDNDLIKERLGWAPSVSLRAGLEETYRWVYDQVAAASHATPADAR